MTVQYRKKPVTIEALQYTGDNLTEVFNFTGKHPKWDEWFSSWEQYEAHVRNDQGIFKILTAEGTMKASVGDYIIKGIKGEFYPCKPDIFVATYDAVPAGENKAASQLSVRVVDDELVISVGIGLLCWAVQTAQGKWPEDWYIGHVPAFAKEIALELKREEEDGTTPVHRMLDSAAESALNGGALSADEGDVELGLDIAKKYMERVS